MSRTIQIFVLCLVAISCAQNQNAPACNPCCSNPTPSPPPCQNTAAPPTPSSPPTPTPCPYATNPGTAQPTNNSGPTQHTNNPGPTQPTNTGNPSSGAPIARQPDPNPTGWPQPMPNYMMVPGLPGYPGVPNMPSFPPYPFLGNYMPIVQDPKTGQRYLIMQNPFLPTNKYSQILNIYSPEMNPGYYAVPPANNATSTESAKPSDKS